MKKVALVPDLRKLINRIAQALVTQAFPAVRADLERRALKMLRFGNSPEEVRQFVVREALPPVVRELESARA